MFNDLVRDICHIDKDCGYFLFLETRLNEISELRNEPLHTHNFGKLLVDIMRMRVASIVL